MSPRSKQIVVQIIIILSIVLILAAIAVPNFLRYATRSRQNIARLILMSIYQAQKNYFTKNGHYAKSFPDLGPDVARKYSFDYYNFYFSADEYSKKTPCIKFECGKLEGACSIPSWVKIYVRDDSFQIIAVGDHDMDEVFDIWMIDDQGKLRHLVKDQSYDQWKDVKQRSEFYYWIENLSFDVFN